MKTWSVTLPIAGHIIVEVEADNADDAIERALEADLRIEHIEGWEALSSFHEGNVCYCPHPWEAEAECVDGDEEEEAE